MSQVNLLPPELRQRQATRRATSIVVLVGLALLALVGLFYFLQVQRLSEAQDALEAQQARNAELEGQIAGLQQFAALQAELASKEALLATIFENEVSWSSALLDVSRVIPDASYLTNLTGAGHGARRCGGRPAGDGRDARDHLDRRDDVHRGRAGDRDDRDWLTRLEQVQGWVNAWANSAQEDAPGSRVYTFANGLDLTQEAATERGHGLVTP